MGSVRINVKNMFYHSNFIVVQDRTQLEKITALLDQQGIPGLIKRNQPKTYASNLDFRK